MTSNSYGLPFDYAESAAERINSVSLDEVNDRARQLIQPGSLTWIVVGDLEQIEEKIRSLNYGDVEIWDGFGNRLR